MKTISFTGHRDIQGQYDLEHPSWKKVEEILYNILDEYIEKESFYTFISGAAIGFDTLSFMVVDKLKDKHGNKIKNILAIPFCGHHKRWNKEQISVLDNMILKADSIEFVHTKDGYESNSIFSALQKRNEYMVDKSNLVISLYNGSLKGGTYNCLKYAKNKNSNIVTIYIKDIENIEVIKNDY